MTDQHARVRRRTPAGASTVLKGRGLRMQGLPAGKQILQAETVPGLIYNRAHGDGCWQLAAT
jgi:hypothetical protein